MKNHVADNKIKYRRIVVEQVGCVGDIQHGWHTTESANAGSLKSHSLCVRNFCYRVIDWTMQFSARLVGDEQSDYLLSCLVLEVLVQSLRLLSKDPHCLSCKTYLFFYFLPFFISRYIYIYYSRVISCSE